MNLAIIPARAGSKGLKNKNIAPLCGKPLIRYTIDAAIQSKFFDKIVVSTDSEKIASLCNGVDIIMRPKELARDDVPSAPVIKHALKTMEERDKCVYDVIFTLQPTSPLRNANHIQDAFQRFVKTRSDSLLSVKEELHSIWTKTYGDLTRITMPARNRQYITKPYYVGNGAIFITKRNILLDYDSRIGRNIEIYVMKECPSVDIHTAQDIDLAEFYLNRRKL